MTESGGNILKKSRTWRYVILMAACVYALTFSRFQAFNFGTKLLRPLPVQWDPEEDSGSNSSLLSRSIPSLIQHRYFLRQCYSYEGLTAKFNCSGAPSFRQFSHDSISECFWDLWDVVRNKSEPNPWTRGPEDPSASAVTISKRPSVHLVFVGDSHIRNLFEVFFNRILHRRVLYHSSGMREDAWKIRSFKQVQWNNKKKGNSHELIHLDVPLRITFYWDPLLALLPSYIASWMSGNSSRPTYLITSGTALHFMQVTKLTYLAEGMEASSKLFYNHMKEISPLLEEFSKITPIFFKLQDHLKITRENNFMNRRLVDHCNQISYELLPKSSNLIVWSSTIPLSDIFWDACRKGKGARSHRGQTWKCWNSRHLGFIMIDQFLDMFLNGVCCRFVNKGS